MNTYSHPFAMANKRAEFDLFLKEMMMLRYLALIFSPLPAQPMLKPTAPS
ncbi:hypothetical protein [Bradyrhizobium elkanii]|nr:hypothetical protein [Bradyrhizobium elkanii]